MDLLVVLMFLLNWVKLLSLFAVCLTAPTVSDGILLDTIPPVSLSAANVTDKVKIKIITSIENKIDLLTILFFLLE
jgi:hypothetical protein